MEELIKIYRNAINDSTSSETFFNSIKSFCSRSSSFPTIANEHRLTVANFLTCLSTIYQTVDLCYVFKTFPLLDFVTGLSFAGVRCKTTNCSDCDVETLALNCLIELSARNFPLTYEVERLKLFEFLYILVRELNSLEPIAGLDSKSKLSNLNET